jgi:hypothetical protein
VEKVKKIESAKVKSAKVKSAKPKANILVKPKTSYP